MIFFFNLYAKNYFNLNFRAKNGQNYKSRFYRFLARKFKVSIQNRIRIPKMRLFKLFSNTDLLINLCIILVLKERYRVLATDYTNFAVEYSCSDTSLMSRKGKEIIIILQSNKKCMSVSTKNNCFLMVYFKGMNNNKVNVSITEYIFFLQDHLYRCRQAPN